MTNEKIITNEEVRLALNRLYPEQTAQEQMQYSRAVLASAVYRKVAEDLHNTGFTVTHVTQRRDIVHSPSFRDNPQGYVYIDDRHVGRAEMEDITKMIEFTDYNLEFHNTSHPHFVSGTHKESEGRIVITNASYTPSKTNDEILIRGPKQKIVPNPR